MRVLIDECLKLRFGRTLTGAQGGFSGKLPAVAIHARKGLAPIGERHKLH